LTLQVFFEAGQVGEEWEALSREREIKQGVKWKIKVGPPLLLSYLSYIKEITNYFDYLFLK